MKARVMDLEYPVLHQEPGDLILFLSLRDLFDTCCYTQFSWKDLYHPNPKRLRCQLSAVLNLAKFREEQLKVYEDVTEQRHQLIRALDEVNLEQEQLQRQLETAEQSSQGQFAVLQEIQSECQDLELDIARHNRLQAQAREEASRLKKQANDLKDELASVSWALQEAEAEEESWRAQLVSSPDRRHKELERNMDKLQQEKQESDQLQTRIATCKLLLHHSNEAIQQLESTTSQLGDLKKAVARRNDLERQLESTQQAIAETEQRVRDLEREQEQAERALARADEKIAHQRQHYAMQLEATQEALEFSKAKLLEVEQDRREGLARVEAGEHEVQQLQSKMEQEKETTHNELQVLISDYKATERLFLQRNAQKMQALVGS